MRGRKGTSLRNGVAPAPAAAASPKLRAPSETHPIFKHEQLVMLQDYSKDDTFTGLRTAAEFPSLNRYVTLDTVGTLAASFPFLEVGAPDFSAIARPKKSTGPYRNSLDQKKTQL